MSSVAIIPARGGSRRIPKKCIREFADRPIIAYSIDAALESGLFQRVIVSTDSQEIADVAVALGAEAPFLRPAELADDFTGTDAVILHALDWLKSEGDLFDYACCVYATAPFIQARFLADGYRVLTETEATTAFSVATWPFPLFRALKLSSEGRLEMFWPEHRLTRSQDLPDAYYDAGQFYWLDVAKYTGEGKLFSIDSVPVVIPGKFVHDIDTEEDWETAEGIHAAIRNEE
ncbi:pseudaminic acid cytidylyltransferase [Verrucomicrobiota bacterium]